MIERSMQLIGNPHIFSNLILSFIGVFIFLRYFGAQPTNNRWLWGVYLLSISFSAFIDLLYFSGIEPLGYIVPLFAVVEMTLGAVCLVVASWSLIMKIETSRMLLFGALFFGGSLFYCVTWFRVEYISLIVKAFCIVVTLLICCLGLGNRQKSALWVIISMMLIALATKSKILPLPMHPQDVSHYMTALAIMCIGWAVRDESKILF
jgi:hypothetical protein